MPKFKIRLVVDEDFEIEANDEDEAIEEAWNQMFDTGAYGLTCEEIEEEEY